MGFVFDAGPGRVVGGRRCGGLRRLRFAQDLSHHVADDVTDCVFVCHYYRCFVVTTWSCRYDEPFTVTVRLKSSLRLVGDHNEQRKGMTVMMELIPGKSRSKVLTVLTVAINPFPSDGFLKSKNLLPGILRERTNPDAPRLTPPQPVERTFDTTYSRMDRIIGQGRAER